MSKKSKWCGKKLKICYEKKCTVATVTDACPGCKKGKHMCKANKNTDRLTCFL